jgi:hypothetical protein
MSEHFLIGVSLKDSDVNAFAKILDYLIDGKVGDFSEGVVSSKSSV